MRSVLLLFVALAVCGCNVGQNDEYYNGTALLHRWKVTDANGAVLSQGCGRWDEPGGVQAAYPPDATDYWATRIEVKAAPGSTIIDEDNFGTAVVSKGRSSAPLPDTDQYWCSSADVDTANSGPAPTYALGNGVTEADTNPAAVIQSFTLLSPETDEMGTSSLGFRMTLLVKHTGVVHLERPWLCGYANADAGDAGCTPGTATYGALTIVQ